MVISLILCEVIAKIIVVFADFEKRRDGVIYYNVTYLGSANTDAPKGEKVFILASKFINTQILQSTIFTELNNFKSCWAYLMDIYGNKL